MAISLIQCSKWLGGEWGQYSRANFMVTSTTDPSNIVWQMPPESQIVCKTESGENQTPSDGIITENLLLDNFPDKQFGYYMLIPNFDKDIKKEQMNFYF